MILLFYIFAFGIGNLVHTYNLQISEEELPSYSCFEKDSPPVDIDEIFEDHCVDNMANEYNDASVLTSCCHCLLYTCTFITSFQNKTLYFWNTTVSDQCCLHCNGTVFKSDSLIDKVYLQDECKTIESSFCRILPDYNHATIEKHLEYEKCCNDNTGLWTLETIKLEPSTCSQRTCHFSETLPHSIWQSEQVVSGCDCCEVNGELLKDATEWTENGTQFECCKGNIVIKFNYTTTNASLNTDKTTAASSTTYEPSTTESITTTMPQTTTTTTLTTTSLTAPSTSQDCCEDSGLHCEGVCLFDQCAGYCQPNEINSEIPSSNGAIGVLISGGENDKSVEVFNPETRTSCNSEDLPEPMLGHYAYKNMICRGPGCIKYSGGQWTNFTQFPHPQGSPWYYAMAEVDLDTVLLMSQETSLFVNYDNGSTSPGPDMKYSQSQVYVYASCAIPDEGEIILTGGKVNNVVSRYNRNGWLADLQPMIRRRYDHACSYYHNSNFEMVYLVAGGYDGHTYLSSTEIMVKGSNLWTEVGGLSYGARGMRAVSWENTVLVFGGASRGNFHYSNISRFNNATKTWSPLGSMKRPRYKPGISLVNIQDF